MDWRLRRWRLWFLALMTPSYPIATNSTDFRGSPDHVTRRHMSKPTATCKSNKAIINRCLCSVCGGPGRRAKGFSRRFCVKIIMKYILKCKYDAGRWITSLHVLDFVFSL